MNATMALMGNPNSGKTTLFNNLTGSRQHVGNYPGITVEKREGRLRIEDLDVTVVDLPGTYSLTAYSQDELVARNFLVEARPDAVVAVLDATNLERSLYLVVQILELGTPVIVALNMMDEVRRKGVTIDTGRLSSLLGTPILELVARTGEGRDSLLFEARKAIQDKPRRTELRISYGLDLDETLDRMQALIESADFLGGRYPVPLARPQISGERPRGHGRGRGQPRGPRTPEGHGPDPGRSLSQDPERRARIHHRRLPLWIHHGSAQGRRGHPARHAGPLRSDGQARQRADQPSGRPGAHVRHHLRHVRSDVHLGRSAHGLGRGLYRLAGRDGHGPAARGPARSLVVSGIIDGVGGVLGFTPLIMIMFFLLSFLEDSGYMARMAYMLDRVFRIFGLHGCSVMPFIISGGIPGGCAVPGVMAGAHPAQPQGENRHDPDRAFLELRRQGAGLPAPGSRLLPGLRRQRPVLDHPRRVGHGPGLGPHPALNGHPGEATPFVMELPPYRMPTLKGMCMHTWERVWQYMKKAGTVILAISVLLWAAMTFPGLPEDQAARFEDQRAVIEAMTWESPAAMEEALSTLDNEEAQLALRSSLAGMVGTALEPLSKPAGFDWRTNIALLGGFAAKEVIVSTLGTSYSLGEVDPEESIGLSENCAAIPPGTSGRP
jgi:ferrous iron transport protein B